MNFIQRYRVFIYIIIILLITFILYKYNFTNEEKYKEKGDAIINTLIEYYDKNKTYPEHIQSNDFMYYSYVIRNASSIEKSTFVLEFSIGTMNCNRGGYNGIIDEGWQCEDIHGY